MEKGDKPKVSTFKKTGGKTAKPKKQKEKKPAKQKQKQKYTMRLQ